MSASDGAYNFTPAEISRYYAARVPHLKQRLAAEWRGPCPIHSGKDDNFAVNAATGQAFCQSQCGRGWDILSLEMEISGHSDFATAKSAVFEIVGRDQSPNGNRRARIFTTYDYRDETGETLYQVCRMEPKDRSEERRVGKERRS